MGRLRYWYLIAIVFIMVGILFPADKPAQVVAQESDGTWPNRIPLHVNDDWRKSWPDRDAPRAGEQESRLEDRLDHWPVQEQPHDWPTPPRSVDRDRRSEGGQGPQARPNREAYPAKNGVRRETASWLAHVANQRLPQAIATPKPLRNPSRRPDSREPGRTRAFPEIDPGAVPMRPATTCTVTSTADNGGGTLRECLENAVSGDVIDFDTSVFPPGSPATIALSSGLPSLHDGNVTIDGSDAGVILDGSSIGAMPETLLLDDVSLTLDGGPNQVINGDYSGGLGHWRPWDGASGVTRSITTGDFHSSPNALAWNAVAQAGDSSTVYDSEDTSDPLSDWPYYEGSTAWIPASGGETADWRFWYKSGGLHAILHLLFSDGHEEGWWTWFDGQDHWVEGSVVETLPAEVVGIGLEFRYHHSEAGASGFWINSSYNTIQGLQILSFPWSGIAIADGAQYNTIGGDRSIGAGPLGQGNVLSGNGGLGMEIGTDCANNHVQGTYVGTDASGTASLPNRFEGIRIEDGANNNIIGGSSPGTRNVLSGNDGQGIRLDDGAHHNTISGNHIGTDASGTSPLPNGWSGVHIENGANSNIVGGATPSEGNVITYNDGNGISIQGSGSGDNVIQNNRVGIDADGTGGLDPRDLVVAEDGTVLLADFGRGVHRSTDAATTWQTVNSGLGTLEIEVVAVSPAYASDGRVWAWGDGQLFVSDDRGASWSLLSTGLLGQVKALEVSPNYAADQTLLAAVSEEGIYKSVDGGANWVEVYDTYNADCLAFSPNFASDGVVLAGLDWWGVLRSVNGGDTWAESNTGLPEDGIYDLAFAADGLTVLAVSHACENDGVYRSTDAGQTWTASGAGLDSCGSGWQVAVSPNFAADGIALAAEDSVFRGYDGASTWQGSDGAFGSRGHALAFSPTFASDQTAYLATFAGVFRTADGGVSWNWAGANLADRGNDGGGIEICCGAGPTLVLDNVIGRNQREGIRVSEPEAAGTLIDGNLVGLGPDGLTRAANGGTNIRIDTPSVTVTGNTSSAGSHGGLRSGTEAHHLIITGNRFGTDVSGTVAVGNSYDGMTLESSWDEVRDNLVSGNWGDAIYATSSATNSVFAGNLIGVDASGTQALGNDGNGIYSQGSECTIGGSTPADRNIISSNESEGIRLEYGAHGNRVSGNYIGTDASGSVALSNRWRGIRIRGDTYSNTVGGDTPGERNLVSGHEGEGILLEQGAHHNTISGNYVGTDASGSNALPNTGDGGICVYDGGYQNRVEGNLVSGNSSAGIYIHGSGTENNTVAGNIVGLNADTTAALGNGRYGIIIFNGPEYNVVGGDTPQERNIVGGNHWEGIRIHRASHNTVIGNYVGTNSSGDAALGNESRGILVWDATHNQIGGTAPGEGNLVSGNDGDGIGIQAGVGLHTMPDLTGLTPEYVGVFPIIDFPDTEGPFASTDGITPTTSQGDPFYDVFAAHFTGTLQIATAGQYTFALGSDDGSLLYIDGELVIDRNYETGFGTSYASRSLDAGSHPIEIDFFESYGSAGLAFYANGQAPISLTTSGGTPGLTGEFFLVDEATSPAQYNIVIGNLVGTDAAGTGPLGNHGSGIHIHASHNNPIGGSTPGAGNVIAYNGYQGVSVTDSHAVRNTISRNSIHDNARRGIDLDDGGNEGLPAPVMTSVDVGAGTASGTACANCTIEVFSDNGDEGRWYEGTTTANGSGDWSLGPGSAFTGPNVHATATDADGNTSEFSTRPPTTCIVTSTGDGGTGTLRECLEHAVPGDVINFDIGVFPPDSPATIALSSGLPDLDDGNVTIDGSNAGVVLDGSGIGTSPESLLLDDVSLTLDGGPEQIVNGNYSAGQVHWRPWEDRPGATWGINTSDTHSAPNAYQMTGPAQAGYIRTVYDTAETSDPVVDWPYYDGSTVWIPASAGQTVEWRFWYKWGWVDANLYVLFSDGHWESWGWGFDWQENWTEAVLNHDLPPDAVGVALEYGYAHPEAWTRGLTITSDGNTVRGLQIVHAPFDGILIIDANSNAIGGDRAIGGGPLGQGNLISANGSQGIQICADSANNQVLGNFIGTDLTGSVAMPNGSDGVALQCSWGPPHDNVIGGTTETTRNLLSGNGRYGVGMREGAYQNVVAGNLIGTDSTGLLPIGNRWYGIVLYGGANNNSVGGGTVGERNVISGNEADGIIIWDVEQNTIHGNYIGVGTDGTSSVGNTWRGVRIAGGASQNLVGGNNTSPGGGCSGGCNLISGNGEDGVEVRDADSLSNTVSENSIYANGGLGIDLVDGGNAQLPASLITSADPGAGTASGTACADCIVEVFSDNGDEGRWYEGTTTANGAGEWSFVKGGAFVGPNVQATATDAADNTSEFSPPGAVMLTDWTLLAPNLETDPPTDAETARTEIGDQGGNALQLCRWQTDVDDWQCYDGGPPANNFTLALGQGYFLQVDTASTWQRTGLAPDEPLPVELDPTWTLMGVPKLPGPMTAEALLGEATDQGGDCTELYRWQHGAWLGHVLGLPFNDFSMTNYEGYFVRCANPVTYTPGGISLQQQAVVWPDPVGPEAMAPVSAPAISDVLVTNHRDVALTITWRTDQPSTGWAEYGQQTALGQSAHDDLGEGAVSMVHHVTLTRLTPETTYYFRVHSGETMDDNSGTLYTATTKESHLPPVPYLAYGQVETTDGQPATGALVRVWLLNAGHALSGVEGGEQSEPLSTLVDGYGYWSMSLPMDKCEDLEVKLEAIGPRGSQAELTQPACEVKPVPNLVLSEADMIPLYLPLISR